MNLYQSKKSAEESKIGKRVSTASVQQRIKHVVCNQKWVGLLVLVHEEDEES